jgi:hypothetical protein
MMQNIYAGAQPCAINTTLLSGALYARHIAQSGTFDAVSLPPTPGIPGHKLYSDRLKHETELLARLGEVLSQLDASQAYIPHTFMMNARIGSKRELVDEVIVTPAGIPIYRSQKPKARMEGCAPEPGEAVIFALGGCGIAMAAGVVAHCGRDSEIDHDYLLDGERSRESFSVVNAIAKSAEHRGLRVEEEPFTFVFGLSAERFGHPTSDTDNGARYERMYEYVRSLNADATSLEGGKVYLDIGKIAAAQAWRAGFKDPVENCTLPIDGSFGYTRHKNEDKRAERNLTFVIRRE